MWASLELVDIDNRVCVVNLDRVRSVFFNLKVEYFCRAHLARGVLNDFSAFAILCYEVDSRIDTKGLMHHYFDIRFYLWFDINVLVTINQVDDDFVSE